MSSQPIGVVIVAWEGRELLPGCLAALADQTRRPDALVVVDNGSSDGTAELAEASWPGARIVRLGSNRGFAAGVNAGLQELDTPLVALLNQDAEPEPEWLEALAEAAGRHPWASSFASRILLADRAHGAPGRVDSAGDSLSFAGHVFKHGHLREDGPHLDGPREVVSVCAGASLHRRGALEALGGMDEWYVQIFEDADLGLRGQLTGHRALYVPGARVRHLLGSSRGRDPAASAALAARNELACLVLNLPGPLLARSFPFWCLRAVYALGLRLARRDHPVAHLRGRLAALAALPSLLARRRERQRARHPEALRRLAALTELRWS